MKRLNIKKLSLITVLLYLPLYAIAENEIIFESFEGENIEINPTGSTFDTKYLWSQYPNGDLTKTYNQTGTVDFLETNTLYDSKAAVVNVDEGAAYFQYFPYSNSKWLFFRETVSQNTKQTWPLNTFNKLEFYVFVPPQLELASSPGNANTTFGTYFRKSDGDTRSAETDGGHFYHRFNIPYTGVWHKVIVDMHPSHERGRNGGLELGNKEQPTGEDGYNYFDLLTRFYIDFDEARVTNNTETTKWLFDNFKIYQDTNLENEEQVYSINGAFIDELSKKRLVVGWNRNKDQNSIAHEVKYAFQSIHKIGWDNAFSAPGSPISPQGYQGYNTILYDTDLIETNSSEIYVAIKPENSDKFKEIYLKLQTKSGKSYALPPVLRSTLKN